jgi:hypothetical protein
MTAINIPLQFEQAVQSFEAAEVDYRIAVIWQTYETLGQAFAAIAPVALFSQAVQQLISQMQQVDSHDQVAILRDIVAGADTRFSQAYQALNTNMKLAFWHRIVHLIPSGRLPLDAFQQSDHNGSAATQTLLTRIDAMGLNERLHFLRRVVG